MAIIVQKFGGSSLADAPCIGRCAQRAVRAFQEGRQVIVVVSAMGDTTDRLGDLAVQVTDRPSQREMDMLLATGEQVSIALMTMALHRLGADALSMTGRQIGLLTDQVHTKARIRSIDTSRLRRELDAGRIVVVAGFQGISDEGQITTLGRGGSDTTAVAIAAALGIAENNGACEIYTDVAGVFTTDPNLVPGARKLDRISYDEMIELSSLGAKVLQIRSARFAMRYGVPLHVRSSFDEGEGTWVVAEEEVMERLVVSGVTYNRNEAKIRVHGVKDQPGIAARIFSPLSDAGIVVDMIVQNLSQDGTTDMTFTVEKACYEQSLEIARHVAGEIGAAAVEGDENIAKVSIVGLGMKDHAGVASKMFQVLADEGINIQLITTSEIKVSVVIEEKYSELAVRALHDAFVEAGSVEPAPES